MKKQFLLVLAKLRSSFCRNGLTKVEDLNLSFFERSAEVVAADLIGCSMFTMLNGCETGGTIIEAEAYDQNDMSAHCYIGHRKAPPASAKPMTFAGGHLYFYYTRNGRCINVTCDQSGFGSAVLIRALRPTVGIEIMRARRLEIHRAKVLLDETRYGARLCNGPQNLCESLGFTDELHNASLAGLKICDGKIKFFQRSDGFMRQNKVEARTRVGIEPRLRRKFPKLIDVPEYKLAIDRPWRWTAQELL
jgi:DNA-3-methyladenine glycosylase